MKTIWIAVISALFAAACSAQVTPPAQSSVTTWQWLATANDGQSTASKGIEAVTNVAQGRAVTHTRALTEV